MIYLTELSNLTEGLYWARKITGEGDLGRSGWMVVCVVGVPPFLDGYVVTYRADMPNAADDPWSSGRDRKYEGFRATEWEFGPRIDIPSDKERAEFSPKTMERTMA